MKFNKKKFTIGSLIFVGLATLGLITLMKINTWFKEHEFMFQAPLQITLQKPIQIIKKALLIPTIINVINDIPTMENLTPIEEYICNEDHWGIADCRIALAVAKAESGMKPDAIGFNKGSVDIGIFQINSVHYKKDICKLEKIVTPEGNVDCAYNIWKDSGWYPWSVFKNGAFKENL